jgi:hypothetical protein
MEWMKSEGRRTKDQKKRQKEEGHPSSPGFFLKKERVTIKSIPTRSLFLLSTRPP